MTNKIHKGYRNIRKLCPKQPDRRIQKHDSHDAPMTPHQEFDSLINHFGMLFRDNTFDLVPQPLRRLPFIQVNLEHDLNRFPITKALAPDGFPTVIQRHFVGELAQIVYQAVG